VASTTTVHCHSRFFGVRFWPDTAHLVPDEESLSRDLVRRLAHLAEPDDVWRELAAWCLEHIASRRPPDAAVRQAICTIIERAGDVSTRDLAKQVQLGPRQLQRRFLSATGLTIKSYARVRRMRSAMSDRLAEGQKTWSMTAATAGYADQAHLAREFSTLTGLAPGEVEEHLSRIDHRNVTP
jgi:transcriptional regulator GlxA family with amidase domain